MLTSNVDVLFSKSSTLKLLLNSVIIQLKEIIYTCNISQIHQVMMQRLVTPQQLAQSEKWSELPQIIGFLLLTYSISGPCLD